MLLITKLQLKILIFIFITCQWISFGKFQLINATDNEINSKDNNFENDKILINNAIHYIINNNNISNLIIITDDNYYAILKLFLFQKYLTISIWNIKKKQIKFQSLEDLRNSMVFFHINSISIFLEHFNNVKKYNPRIKYIITFDQILQNEEICEIFKILWTKKIINSIFIQSKTDLNVLDVFSYFPYENEGCGKFNNDNVYNIGYFEMSFTNNISSIQFISERNQEFNLYFQKYYNKLPFFPPKIPLNLNNCEVKISASVWPPNVIDLNSTTEPGIETALVHEIAKHINAKFVLTTVDVLDMGLKQKNGTWTGKCKLVEDSTIDLLYGAVYTSEERATDFDASSWYLKNNLLWIVPVAQPLKKSEIMWSVFIENSGRLIISLICALIITTILIYFLILTLKYFTNTNSTVFSLLKIAETLGRAYFGQPSPNLTNDIHTRFVFSLWFICCVIIVCYFNTTLISRLTSPGTEQQIDSLQGIIDSKIQIAYDELYNIAMDTFPNSTYFMNNNNKTEVPIALKMTALGKVATITDKARAEYISLKWVDPNGKFVIHYLENECKLYWNHMIMTKGFELYERINEIVKSASYMGFWQYEIMRYHNIRTIRALIQSYMIVSNAQHGISNDESIVEFNQIFTDSQIFRQNTTRQDNILNSTEAEIIERFIIENKLVTLEHLGPAFKMLLGGLLLSLFLFVIEIFYYQIKIYNRNNINRFKKY